MKKTLCLLLAVLFTVTAAAALVGVTVAWLTDVYVQQFPTDFGSSDLAYFAGGKGTADEPYEISHAVHLYNLAWLQYLGYFNRNPALNNGLDQTWFKLTKDVSMAAFASALPPIGTEEYPFIGYFDGNGYTVSDITVSNTGTGTGKNALTIRPAAAVLDGAGILRTAGNTADVSVVGLFGVVGGLKPAEGAASYAEAYAGAHAGFDGTKMHVTGLYADGLHVHSHTAATLCGLLAGYVGANLSHVGVHGGDFVFATGATGIAALLDDGVSASTVSQYSLVGNYDKDLVGWSTLPGGNESGWGGSIDMDALFTRLNGFRTSSAAQKVDSNFNNATNGAHTYYYHADRGSVYFRNGSGNTVLYLYGGKITYGYETKENGGNGFTIGSGNAYLTINNLSQNGASQPTTNADAAVTWYFEEATGGLYAYVDNIKMYLNARRALSRLTPLLSSTRSTVWTKTANQLTTTEGGATYYLQYSGTSWRGTTSPGNVTFTTMSNRRYLATTASYSGTISGGSTRNFATYFPINADENGNATQKNTGYIASGPFDATINGSSAGGDIRVAKYSVDSAIQASVNGAATFGNGTTLELLTCNKNSGGFVRIKDAFNANNTVMDAGIGAFAQKTVAELGLKKYAASRAKLNTALAGKSDIWGLHFMNAQISMRNLYRADKATINGETYTDYQMPANSINFRVQTKGYIDFFSHTRTGTGFFSLHEIFRDAVTNDIIAIKEISRIYGKTMGQGAYVYEYTDGTFSDGLTALPDGYAPEFDCAWIASPTLLENAMYYMEIPVNGGEYALGSTSAGDGAYLVYLDIGANAAGEGPSDIAYTLDSVDFIHTEKPAVERDADGKVMPGSWPDYATVVAALSGADGTPPRIVFRRDPTDHTQNAEGAYTAVLHYRAEGLTVGPMPAASAVPKPDLSFPDENTG